MKLSVIICCYNERASIMEVINRTQAADLGPDWDREILVVDNYSTDGTRELLQTIDDPEIRTFFHDRNRGKGSSIRTGIAHMSGDYFFIQDADTEYDPTDQHHFCRHAQRTQAAAIFGSRVLGGETKSKYWRTLVGNRFVTWLANFLFGGQLTDVATASKMARADVVRPLHLESEQFDLDFELPAKILMSGHQIDELAVSYRPRTYEEGKKIGFRDAIDAVVVMLRVRLGLSPVYQQLPGRADIPVQTLGVSEVEND
jgi:glycosyltransferase involved in cell wall biosynthesis